MELREKIIASLRDAAEIRGGEVRRELSDDTILLDSGLDSLGFAILVTKLEEELGYDPFVQMTEPVYPRTLGEFVEIYRRYAPAA
jgi:acyl carrier protein